MPRPRGMVWGLSISRVPLGGVVLPECLAIDTDSGAHTQPWVGSIPFRSKTVPSALQSCLLSRDTSGLSLWGTACLGDILRPLAPNLGPPNPQSPVCTACSPLPRLPSWSRTVCLLAPG